MKTQIYSRYNRPSHEGLTFSEPTMTQQHMKDECDINLIIQRAIACGDTTVFTSTERAAYYDNTQMGDYQTAMDFLNGVKADFNSLPSALRANFSNDLGTYVQFMCDPANTQQAIDLGLIELGEHLANPLPTVSTGNLSVDDVASNTTETDIAGT